MRTAARLMLALALVAPALPVSVAQAQDRNMAHVHLGHVADRFAGTPSDAGLIAAALAEAQVAAQHAGLAGQEPENLAYIKQHTVHVLHAIDPTVEEEGPGGGYGAKQAAGNAIQHITMAADFEGASTAVEVLGVQIATATGNVVRWADELIAVGQQILASEDAAAVVELVAEMATLANKIVGGFDVDEDGRITWQEGEGGLRQASEHADLLKRAEGLGGPER